MAGTHPPVLAAPQPTVEERLRDLKRFRDEGLVSDQDYEKQKQALLLQFQEHGNTSHLPSPAGTPENLTSSRLPPTLDQRRDALEAQAG
jgi:hypothetical protein